MTTLKTAAKETSWGGLRPNPLVTRNLIKGYSILFMGPHIKCLWWSPKDSVKDIV